MFSQSESIASLSKALVAFHRDVKKIGKDADNPFFRSKYASLENILDAVAEPLEKAGLSIVQLPDEGGLATQLVHESGEWIRATGEMRFNPMVVNKSTGETAVTPQSVGSAISYYRRYGVASVLCLNIGDDDDGNAASHSPAPNTGSGNDWGSEDPPSAAGPKVSQVTLTVQSKRELTSSSGNPYAVITTTGGKDVKAWKNTMDQLQEGGTYVVSMEEKEYRGKPDYSVVRVVGIPDPSEQP